MGNVTVTTTSTRRVLGIRFTKRRTYDVPVNALVEQETRGFMDAEELAQMNEEAERNMVGFGFGF